MIIQHGATQAQHQAVREIAETMFPDYEVVKLSENSQSRYSRHGRNPEEAPLLVRLTVEYVVDLGERASWSDAAARYGHLLHVVFEMESTGELRLVDSSHIMDI